MNEVARLNIRLQIQKKKEAELVKQLRSTRDQITAIEKAKERFLKFQVPDPPFNKCEE